MAQKVENRNKMPMSTSIYQKIDKKMQKFLILEEKKNLEKKKFKPWTLPQKLRILEENTIDK